jgi:general stress protein 26
MVQEVLDYLESSRVSSLTILRKDGMPHSAALHYSYKDDPLTFYFSTENTSRKCEAILDGTTALASLAIGFDEKNWLEFQADGEVRLVNSEELVEVQNIHYKKNPHSEKFKDDPSTVFLAFTPKWWRFSDMNSWPYKIISSEK